MKSLRLALCQINSTVGDIEGNLEKILQYIKKAKEEKAEIVVFPELALTGYTPEDLLLYPQFIKRAKEALERVVEEVSDQIVILGVPYTQEDLYNSAAVVADKKLVDLYHKIYLPNYSVFDEVRYFKSGKRAPVYEYGSVLFGLNICEDIFHSTFPSPFQAYSGAELIINISASPFYVGKFERKLRMLSTRAFDFGVFIVYLNSVGGQDEVVFDGRSLIISPSGDVITVGKAFEEDFIIADLDLEEVTRVRMREPKIRWESKLENFEIVKIPIEREESLKPSPKPLNSVSEQLSEEEEIFKALITGLRDYVNKNGFKRVCLGLSGGIDSSFVALVAAEALGKENVIGLFMPSRYTSRESREDVYELSKNLGIELIEISIDEIFERYLNELSSVFKGLPEDTTEENIQSRIRGTILMALSNKFGWLVLTTGNKSEMAVGYATLYGDMAGGFAPIKDLYKTQVYKVARWISKDRIPERVFTKAPTAELRPGQKDQDTLPPYEILDEVLKIHIEKCMTLEEIVQNGFDRDTVKKILKMVKAAEFKRRQSPPGIKLSPVSLGKDWRFPITNRFGG
ncbi:MULTISPECIES: NAD+ synthase [Thermodesulfovibrio]|uniref:NAD+ synthase n=1 Tax=Thermodesulfovibrio TaxID=28261 RepID=UPI00262EBE82|nr:NAD+ synthase [Thermodesulfovibrio sp.]